MVIFGGCVTTIFYCGTRDGAWPFYPVLKRKYCGRFDNAYPTQIFYLLLISGFLLYASYLLHLLSSDIVQIAIIFVYIGYTIFAGTLYPRGAYFRTKSSLSSFLSILFHLGAVLCFILACIFLFQLAISPLSGYLSQFPTIYTFISLIISSITQFPLCSFVLSIHSQLQSHLSFFGLSGIWWSFILMMDLGVIFFYIEKKFSSYSYYGLLHSRSFSIMASVSVVITIIAIVASCIIMGLNYLPENMPDGNQDSSKTQWVTDYSKTSPVNKRVFQNQPEHNENRDTSVVNSGHVESLLASMTNQQRSQAGIPQLSYDGGLAGLAKSRSENMAGRRTVDHQGLPEGVGENCAMNYVSGSDEAIAQAIMSQWIGSPGHRNNILDQRYTRFGLGVTVSGEYVYAVQDFQF